MGSDYQRLTKAFDAADTEVPGISRTDFELESAPNTQPTTYASRLRWLLLPEFLRGSNETRPKLRNTSYLDGIRGLAAVIVYLAHNLLSANSIFTPLEVAFGYQGKNRYLINLPFLRLLFTGSHVAVPIFFVISGYVQARKPVQQLHNKQEISGTLASAIFRRPFRLYTPVIGSTLSFAILWHLLGITPAFNHHEPNLVAELKYYAKSLWYWTYIFRSKHRGYFADHLQTQNAWLDYNGHTWTIRVELQGSIVVCLFLLFLSKAKPKARISITSAAALYFLVQGNCYVSTFLAGSVIAELDLLSTSPRDFLIAHNFPFRTPIFLVMLCLGCYLGAPPAMGLLYMSSEMMSEQPGWHYISRLVPWIYYDVIHFLVSIASVFIIVPIMALPQLRWPFESGPMQYLGRISFALYLVHGPVLETLGLWMYAMVGKTLVQPDVPASPWQDFLPVPKVGPSGFDLPFIVANLVIFPVTLCAAEICMRLFDKTSVVIARRAYELITE
ncbi:Putative uncharacterized protein [Taphrina deformans PYCC 5710]|uniref:Acyltransferase 3 domain-containing protein n=1 Tax=Taphrina deformans (strain PYCC 5710 / ATCC 11124 / CBS 356.35 / IMI 108563 / JCM 9778 / NBRC 8474) TaxID=1097556 RepID=R4X9C0_TAPDE|nr:Putative uncharacterized protein [Taphrina deformans PYCC 5710]|eukprot:CCG82290.1 Putative uncharacterized protein [Taphrina deformans PYCC 5710]